MANDLLPMFPLPVVLFPEELLPLHIFEERYKQMIGECLDGSLPFGVVLAEESGFRQIGCSARIVEVVQKFSDGRMNIVIQGEDRFLILQTHQEKPYLTADVEFFEDAREEAPSGDLVDEVVQAFQAVGGETDSPSGDPPEDPTRLSFRIGAALGLPLRDKQELLENDSLGERLHHLVRMIEGKKHRVEQVSRQQKSAIRNGHPKKPDS